MSEADPLARFRHTTCLHCGYDMRGAVGDAQCPECGLEHHQGLIFQKFPPEQRRWRWTIVCVAPLALLILGMILDGSAMSGGGPLIIDMAIGGASYLLALPAILWMIWRPRATPDWVFTLVNDRGWTSGTKPVPAGHEYAYYPWSCCVQFTMTWGGGRRFSGVSGDRFRECEIRFHRPPAGGETTRLKHQGLVWNMVRAKTTAAEAAALQQALNEWIEATRVAPPPPQVFEDIPLAEPDVGDE
jgi:hypothetical protein